MNFTNAYWNRQFADAAIYKAVKTVDHLNRRITTLTEEFKSADNDKLADRIAGNLSRDKRDLVEVEKFLDQLVVDYQKEYHTQPAAFIEEGAMASAMRAALKA